MPVQPGPRHLRRFFAAAIEVAPPLLQAIAAVSATIAFTYLGRHFVQGSLAVAITVLSAVLLVGSSLWSWLARRELLKEKSIPIGPARRRIRASSMLWIAVAAAAFVVEVVLCFIVTGQGLRETPSYASPYDGADPGDHSCVGSAATIPSDTHPQLDGPGGKRVGHLELRRSQVCAAVWVRVVFDLNVGPTLKGMTARITMIRPADGVRAPYPLPLRGGDAGFGNMLSDAGACVQAEVFLQSGGTGQSGPTAQTVCA